MHVGELPGRAPSVLPAEALAHLPAWGALGTGPLGPLAGGPRPITSPVSRRGCPSRVGWPAGERVGNPGCWRGPQASPPPGPGRVRAELPWHTAARGLHRPVVSQALATSHPASPEAPCFPSTFRPGPAPKPSLPSREDTCSPSITPHPVSCWRRPLPAPALAAAGLLCHWGAL